jgi:hypothetical protein
VDVRWLEEKWISHKEMDEQDSGFIDRAFSLSTNRDVKCSCSRCRNALCDEKRALTLHLCKFSFMLGYEV